MPFPPNVQMKFVGYELTDTGITLKWVCNNPGEEGFSDWTTHITDAEIAAVSTQPQLVTLVTNKLQRKFRASQVASKLDQFIGQSITI